MKIVREETMYFETRGKQLPDSDKIQIQIRLPGTR